ncbi:MAG TPA: DUF2064 domain-containing protein [Thermoanaerobaculia bacterium]
MSRAVVLFARSPAREAVAKGLRIATAAPLFGALFTAWIDAARQHGAMPVVACAAEDRAALEALANHRCLWLTQRGVTFGARVAAAADDAFALGFRAVLIAATDAPPTAALAGAFAALDDGRPVIAPARDGGINFLGITQPEPALLTRLAPRQRNLVALCRAYFAELVLLDAVVDVDSPASLAAARRDEAWRLWRALLVLPVVEPMTVAFHIRRGVARVTSSRPPPAL